MGNIAENIIRRRTEAGLTQKYLAYKVGITQSMLSQIERGTKVPTISLGKQLAKTLKCKIDDLAE